jgi:hypothetical protein
MVRRAVPLSVVIKKAFDGRPCERVHGSLAAYLVRNAGWTTSGESFDTIVQSEVAGHA